MTKPLFSGASSMFMKCLPINVLQPSYIFSHFAGGVNMEWRQHKNFLNPSNEM
jgi:hypothetical protein